MRMDFLSSELEVIDVSSLYVFETYFKRVDLVLSHPLFVG